MTLIEILVVLAIIAITAGISVLAIGTGNGANTQAEAGRLVSRLQLAADRAMVEDSDIALMPTRDGYSFMQWDAVRGWRPSRFAKLGERHQLPSGVMLSVDDSRTVLPLGVDAGGRGFNLTLTAKDSVWTVVFDGITARLQTDRPQPAAPAGA